MVPPIVQVTATYLGGSAADVERTVAQPLEAQLVSLDNMIYMSGNMGNSGSLSYQLTYEVGTDPNEATVQVLNKYQLASAQLPQEVIQQGVNIQKTNPAILFAIALYSPDKVYDDLFLSNYVAINLNDFVASLPGVGQVSIAGARRYGMRLWLDPDKLARLGLTATDIRQVVTQQNRQNPSGQIGAPPIKPGIDFQYQVLAQGRLTDADEFANMVVRALPDGSILRIKDVARVELGAQTYQSSRPVQRRPRQHHARVPGARRQRARRGPERQAVHGGGQEAVPAGSRLRHQLRHHGLRAGVHGGGDPHPGRGDCSWCCSWCSSSSRTGGPPSSRS